MFDTPADAWYLWLGLAAASALAFGVAVALPTSAPPDAARAAATVDAVATSPFDATGKAPLDAERVDVDPHGLGLRNEAGTAHASFAYGPVTPVGGDPSLARVLDGAPPERVFEDATAFRAAAAAARNGTGEWERADGELRVRRVTWEDVDVTLVGA